MVIIALIYVIEILPNIIEKRKFSLLPSLCYNTTMISYLSGTIIAENDRFLVLNVSGIGYKVFVTQETTRRAKKTAKPEFWTHLAVRENALDLYGFLEQSELDFFELLLTVSGIGPKTALGILNVAPIETILTAIQKNDSGYLTKTSGVGTKNAQKIVMELKGKIDGFKFLSEENAPEEDDALDALQALGYSLKESREALKNISPESKTPSEKVKEALKILGK